MDDRDINESLLTNDQKVEWHIIKWKNRRRMAWGAFWNLTLIIILLFFSPISESRLSIISDALGWLSFVFGGVIGAYMGFTTMEKYKLGRSKGHEIMEIEK